MKKKTFVNPGIPTMMASVHASPIMQHMRRCAYTPVEVDTNKYRDDAANLEKAELKRLRKQQKRGKENGNH